MASIDERVVAMSFENLKFEQGVAKTMATLTKLNATIASVGKDATGFSNIEKAASKVTLQAPMSALDKLRARLGGVGANAGQGFNEIDRAGNKVSLTGPLTALDKLRTRLFGAGKGASEGFNDIERASSKVTLAPLSSALDHVTAKFSGMTVAFSAALGTMVSTATMKAGQIAKSLTLGPITDGLSEYTTNLQSIQTILANTQFEGANLKDVNQALQELNRYSDQTIYNFGQMAKNIGTFTAAGVDLKTSVASIKGLANLAALSGSSAEQASGAMYQLSQEIAAGKVGLQGWNSVVNAGMGGATFQRALINTGAAMGTIADGAVKIDKETGKATISGQSFRESITARPGEKSWLSSEVLTNTLKQFTGDMSKAELAAQGFSDAQIKAIMKTAQTAKNAATQVKTLKGVFDVAKEAIGTGWSSTFQIIFGNFKEAKKTFTDLSVAINGVIGKAAKARNEVLTEWKKLGGRNELIKGLKAAFEALLSVLKPIKEAFRDIFPRKTGQDLYDLTVRFREFMETLKIGPETAQNLRRTFAGFFALLHIGITVVKNIMGVIFDLLGMVGQGSGGFLAFTGSIGDFLVALDQAISKGKGLEGVFDGLKSSLQAPLELLKGVASALKGLFGDADPGSASQMNTAIDNMTKSLGPLGDVLRFVNKAWERFQDLLDAQAERLRPIVAKVKEVFSKVGNAVVEGLKSVDYDKVMTFIQTTFLGGIAIGVKKLLKGIGIDLSGGGLDNFKEVTKTLTGTLTAIQKNINARTMLLIAAAVLALAGASILFSQVDAKKLGQAMAAISVGIGQLVGAMALLTKIGGHAAFLTLPFAAAAILILATALVILAGAVHLFARLSWEDLGKGLLGVAGGLAAIGGATKLMGPSLILVGPGLIAVAIAMNLLAVAMKIMGSIGWGDLIKGIIGIAGALVAIGVSVRTMGPGLLIAGPGLILIALGLILLSGAVSSFGAIGLVNTAKGLIGIAASLVVIGAAISAIPPTIALQAAGLILLGIGLTGISIAVAAMGNLGWGTIIKGLIGIGLAMVVFADGLMLMSGTLPGSLALLSVASALSILVPTIVVLGSLKWSTIGKGLGAIAATLLVLAAVGAIASGPLTALGIALLVIGGSVLLVSAGIYLLAKAISLLGDKGQRGFSVMIAAITALIAIIPSMVIDFVKGIVEILTQVAKLAPQIAKSLVSILGTWIGAMEKLLPKVAELIGKVIAMIVKLVQDNAGPLIDAGLHLLLHFLSGIDNNIGAITTHVAGIITGFLTALANKAPALVAAGARFLVAWLNGISSKIGGVVHAAANVVVKFVGGIAKELPRVYAQGVKLITNFLRSVADAIPKVIAAGTRIIVKFLNGIANAIPRIVAAGVRVVRSFLNAVATQGPKIVDAAFKAIIKFINGLARAIRANNDALIDAGWNLASAIGEGVIKGLISIGPRVAEAAKNLAKKIPKAVTDFLHITSPSKVMTKIGEYTMLGLAKGLEDGGSNVIKTMGEQSDQVVATAKKTLAALPSILGDINANPTITPVLDLSLLKKNAGEYNRLVNPNVTPITAASSLRLASAAAPTDQQPDAETGTAIGPGMVFRFEQNNNSPKALSTLEIYRQTKNQLSQVKGALGMAK